MSDSYNVSIKAVDGAADGWGEPIIGLLTVEVWDNDEVPVGNAKMTIGLTAGTLKGLERDIKEVRRCAER